MAFTTLFAVMLAIAKPFNPPGWVYWYLGVLGLSVCVAQMYGRISPRGVSIVVGALTLPPFLLYGAWQARLHIELAEAVLGAPCALFGGGFLGYLMGTVAAGVFLLGDKLERRVRGSAPMMAETVDAQLPEGVPFYRPDSCTPYLGDAAAELSGNREMTPVDGEGPRVKPLGPPTGVPVYNCLALVSPRDAQGLVHVRAANLSDLRTSGPTEREALQHLVGAFKIIITQSLAEGRDVPLLATPHEPLPGEQQRFIAVHL